MSLRWLSLRHTAYAIHEYNNKSEPSTANDNNNNKSLMRMPDCMEN